MMAKSDYLKGLDAAYQGEVYGIAMYDRIASARTRKDEQEKWQILVRLEKATKEVLEPVLRRHGVETDPRAESRQMGEQDADNYMNLPWAQLMRRFSDELDADIEEYSALLDLAPGEDHAAIRFLVDHEIVTKVFCDEELSGNHKGSIRPVEALIERGIS